MSNIMEVKGDRKLGFAKDELLALGALDTALEICQQPSVWKSTFQLLLDEKTRILSFLQRVYSYDGLKVILTGAGTSAYIGDVLSQSFQKFSGHNTWAIATTDLVSHPQQYFSEEDTVLLVSFARSGNSPESMTVVDLAESLCKRVFHLVITCNVDGDLVSAAENENACFVFLPKEANDKALAMTSSFTSMLLAGLLISRLDRIEEYKEQVDVLARYGQMLLTEQVSNLHRLSKLNFDRAIFLGGGPLRGAARECQLKLQELTAGKVICKYDSFLGVRHGPKVVIDEKTLVVFIFSNDVHAHKYEVDLVKSINASKAGLYTVGVGEPATMNIDLDLYIPFSAAKEPVLDEVFLAIVSVLPAQIIGFLKGIDLGLSPDSPSINGAISRVVQGVTIYPLSLF